MTKFFKVGMGVAATSALALALAVPVFNEVDPASLRVNEARVASVYVADEDVVDVIVTEADTEENKEADTEQIPEEDTEQYTEVNTEEYNSETEEIIKDAKNYIEIIHDPEGVHIGREIDMDEALEKSKEFHIEKYDDDMKSLAEEYLAQGYFLSDADYSAEVWESGIGYSIEDEKGYPVKSIIFTNGFDVVDENNGNNTMYMSVLKMTPEEFDEYMMQNQQLWYKTETDQEVKYEASDEYNNETIIYNKEKEIFIYENDFSEAALNAVG